MHFLMASSVSLFLKDIDNYENEKILGKFQRDCIPTTRKQQRNFNTNLEVHKAFNKGGIPLLDTG